MSRAPYVELLRAVPAFRACPDAALAQIARLVDVIELPAGATVAASDRELVLTLGATPVLVVERRAWAALAELAQTSNDSNWRPNPLRRVPFRRHFEERTRHAR